MGSDAFNAMPPMIQQNILWTGVYYHSLENCFISVTTSWAEIRSCIVGGHEDTIYKVDYLIKVNRNWETMYVKIRSQMAGTIHSFLFQQTIPGNWTIDGHPSDEFRGCSDIDISLTPFTNSLPIKRLKLNVHEERQIDVLYFDILGRDVKRVRQKYTRLSELEYKFENVPNDFEAIIQVDQSGLVVSYPGLFERTMMK
jgi:hypothetical protein